MSTTSMVNCQYFSWLRRTMVSTMVTVNRHYFQAIRASANEVASLLGQH
jgi:hypothetical protein